MATEVLHVLHLVGSAVSDFYADLSRMYARDCLAATADQTRYRFSVAYVSPDGRWCFPADLEPQSLAAAPAVSLPDAVAHLAQLAPDVALPQMFCLPGMTTYRALLDLLAIPYVGNAADVMAIGADKARARALVSAAGVDVPPGQVVSRGDGLDTIQTPLPVVVKPVDADNSLGVSLVTEPAAYAVALDLALEHSHRALVETYVPLGREVRCGVLEQDGQLTGLPLEEYAVDPEHKPIRDHADKIDRGSTGDLRLVAKDAEHAWIVDTDDPVTAAVWEAATRCYRALGCRDYGLFDFRVDPDGRPWFLEASLYCSFSPQSVLAVMAEAGGIHLDALFSDLVSRAARTTA